VYIGNYAASSVAWGLGLRRQRRTDFHSRARHAGCDLQVNGLEASRDLQRERVARRNEEKRPSFTLVVPEAFLELANNMWQSPDDVEVQENRIELISTPRARKSSAPSFCSV